MENFAGSRKVAHILKVWFSLITKIFISSRSVENSSVMSHSPAALLVLFIYLFNQNNTPHIRQRGLVNRGS
jgi:hypothetical protein